MFLYRLSVHLASQGEYKLSKANIAGSDCWWTVDVWLQLCLLISFLSPESWTLHNLRSTRVVRHHSLRGQNLIQQFNCSSSAHFKLSKFNFKFNFVFNFKPFFQKTSVQLQSSRIKNYYDGEKAIRATANFCCSSKLQDPSSARLGEIHFRRQRNDSCASTKSKLKIKWMSCLAALPVFSQFESTRQHPAQWNQVFLAIAIIHQQLIEIHDISIDFGKLLMLQEKPDFIEPGVVTPTQ